MKIVAKALLTDPDQNILVLRRSSTHPHFAHHLDFPGGEVEPEENEIDAVAREIQEESGLTVLAPSLKLVHKKQTESGTLYLVFAGSVAKTKPPVTVSWEHDQYEWLTREQLLERPIPEGVDSYYLTVLDYLRTKSLVNASTIA